MNRLFGVLVCGPLFAAMFGGCSDDPKPPYPDEQSFCLARAEAECVVASKCVAREDDCRLDRRNACEEAGTLARADGIRTYKHESAKPCIDKTREIYAKDTILPADIAQLDDLCGRVWRGNIERLQACENTFACSGDLSCDKGLCAPRVVKKAGELCGNPGEVCDDASFCTQRGQVFQCDAKLAKGAPCSAESAPCQSNLRCAGTCVDRLGSGEVCITSDDCASSAPFCDPYANNRCAAGLRFAFGYPGCAQYGGDE